MELPIKLAGLYRHWEKHTSHSPAYALDTLIIDDELRTNIEYFIRERIRIWMNREQNLPAPYTNDPILASFRFCNIFREFDKQTIQFHTMLNPIRDDFALWLLNMFYFRMVARTETIQEVGMLSFDTLEQNNFFKRLCKTLRPRFGTAYVFPVSTILKSNTPTREEFISFHLPSTMNSIANIITQWKKKSVFEGVSEILPVFGFNHNFLWTEVLIDVAYQYPELIDLYARFPVGPGSLPTLQRIDRQADPSILAYKLSNTIVQTGVTYNGHEIILSAENWEGIGCEFRKYSNLTQGKGRKRRYKQ